MRLTCQENDRSVTEPSQEKEMQERDVNYYELDLSVAKSRSDLSVAESSQEDEKRQEPVVNYHYYY